MEPLLDEEYQKSEQEPTIAYCLRGLDWQTQCANFQLRKLNAGIFWITVALWAIVAALLWGSLLLLGS